MEMATINQSNITFDTFSRDFDVNFCLSVSLLTIILCRNIVKGSLRMHLTTLSPCYDVILSSINSNIDADVTQVCIG